MNPLTRNGVKYLANHATNYFHLIILVAKKCLSRFCLECYNGVISISKTCVICKSDFSQQMEIQEENQECLSALILCEYSQFGCQTILPYKEIIMHKLECSFTPYTCIKCKKN